LASVFRLVENLPIFLSHQSLPNFDHGHSGPRPRVSRNRTDIVWSAGGIAPRTTAINGFAGILRRPAANEIELSRYLPRVADTNTGRQHKKIPWRACRAPMTSKPRRVDPSPRSRSHSQAPQFSAPGPVKERTQRTAPGRRVFPHLFLVLRVCHFHHSPKTCTGRRAFLKKSARPSRTSASGVNRVGARTTPPCFSQFIFNQSVTIKGTDPGSPYTVLFHSSLPSIPPSPANARDATRAAVLIITHVRRQEPSPPRPVLTRVLLSSRREWNPSPWPSPAWLLRFGASSSSLFLSPFPSCLPDSAPRRWRFGRSHQWTIKTRSIPEKRRCCPSWMQPYRFCRRLAVRQFRRATRGQLRCRSDVRAPIFAVFDSPARLGMAEVLAG